MQSVTSMRDRVREEARKETEDRIGRGDWLNDNISFDHSCIIADDEASRKADALLEQLTVRLRRRDWEQKRTDINILCANLLIEGKYKPLSISLDKHKYVKNRYRRASDFTRELVTQMEQGGWLGVWKGINRKKDPRVTRILPTQKFLDYFSPFPQVEYEPVELVILRNAEKECIEYLDTDETMHIRSVLRRANHVNRNAEVLLKNRRLETDLHAVFSNSTFEEGGRLYTSRNGYQSVNNKKKQRTKITINDQPTVELDYSGLHPRLLYAKEGIQYSDDPYKALQNCQELRPFYKHLLLALINASSSDKAVSSGNYELYQDNELLKTIKALDTCTTEIIERLKLAHPKIARYFSIGIGLNLMRLDAKIALDVVEHFTGRDIPILAIHDSFIVQKEWKEELYNTMKNFYHIHSGGYDCEIR